MPFLCRIRDISQNFNEYTLWLSNFTYNIKFTVIKFKKGYYIRYFREWKTAQNSLNWIIILVHIAYHRNIIWTKIEIVRLLQVIWLINSFTGVVR